MIIICVCVCVCVCGGRTFVVNHTDSCAMIFASFHWYFLFHSNPETEIKMNEIIIEI